MRKIAAVSALSLIFALLGIFSITKPTFAKNNNCSYAETFNGTDDPTLYDVNYCVAVPRQNSQISLKIEVTRASGGGIFNEISDAILGWEFGKTTVPVPSTEKGFDAATGQYYICNRVQGINNAAEQLKFTWYDDQDGEICAMDNIDVKPYWTGGWTGFKAYLQNTFHDTRGLPTIIDTKIDPYTSKNLLCAKGEINTALGCIDASNPSAFVGSILTLAVAIGGATALALMLYGFFVITTSAGIPDKVNAGRDIITAAVSGLVFIVLSVILMKIIGVDILNLPGLQ